jgi:hypothetical protein
VVSWPWAKTSEPFTRCAAIGSKPFPWAMMLCFCVLSFHFALIVLPGLFGGDGNLDDRCAVHQVLGLGVLADESNDDELIDHDDEFLLSALSARARKREWHLLRSRGSA